MNYILVVFMVSFPPEQIGPFNNVFACELAANQIKIVRPKTASVCVDLNAKPHHWNGKPVPK